MKTSAKLAFEAILVITVLLALAVAPLAAKAGHRIPDPPPFAEFDANGDGLLSEEEFTAGRDARHARMEAEGRPMRGMSGAPTFAEFDTDGDGALSEAEFAAGHQQHMASMRKKHPDKGKRSHHHGQGHAAFEDIDSNGDGCIDRAELDAHHGMESTD